MAGKKQSPSDLNHANEVRAKLSAKAQELTDLAAKSVDTSSAFYQDFSGKLSDAMTALVQAPVK